MPAVTSPLSMAKRRTIRLVVRLTPEEHRFLRVAAAAHDVSMEGFVRASVSKQAEASPQRKQITRMCKNGKIPATLTKKSQITYVDQI
jgi:uncharacterized protein (DUF1778 family)